MRKITVLLWLCLLFTSVSAQQVRTVSGKVTDESGNPLRGVSVMELGPDKKVLASAITSDAGTFSVRVSSQAKALTFTYVGFSDFTQSIVNLKNDGLVIKMNANTQSIEEVVVTTAGGLKAKKKDLGYATSTVTGDRLTATKPTTIQAGLVGKVAGLTISATNGGVNPSFRIVLRGQRSITGNNQALIVLDNVIVPNELLANLNPEDVEDITVLNGSNAAALYGSEASNGALLITTKKGTAKGAPPSVTIQHTLTRESVSYLPKLQQRFGSGSSANFPIYTPYENQQYGPAFDGTLRPIGQPLADGSIQVVPYSPVDGKNSFWQPAWSNQTDISVATSDDKGNMRVSAQYVDGNTTTPKDKFNKVTIGLRGRRMMSRNLEATYNINYTQNRYDITSQTSTIYAQLMQTPAQIQVKNYQDWRNDKYSTPDGYYNPFYQNPYFLLDNNRQYTRNDYMTASIDLKYSPKSWIDITFRNGITTRNNSSKSTTDKYTYSDFARLTTLGSYKKTDLVGSVGETSNYNTRVTSELQLAVRRRINDFNFRFTGGFVVRQDIAKNLSASISGLVVPGLFNLSNTLVVPSASESSFKARQYGAYGDLNVGYKNYLNLHATFRNDWVSILNPENRSFFYPGVDLAFSPMEVFPALKKQKALTTLKLRMGWSKVGQVNLGSSGNFGAYQLDPTFSQQYGYPYPAGGGFGLSNTIVSNNLRPEITKQWEGGFDATWWGGKITTNFTYYSARTSDQTVSTGVSPATGFSSYLLNAALTNSKGIELTTNATLIRSRNWELNVGAVYTHVLENKVLAITADIQSLSLGSGVFAMVGQPFPVIFSTNYRRDSMNRVIVDPVTGYPVRANENKVLGNTAPKDILGVNFSLSYKNFRLSAQAEYRGGNVTYMNNTTAFDFSGGGLATVMFNRERFVFPNSSIPDPSKPGQYMPNNNITVRDGGYGFWTQAARTGVAENYVASGAFWKLREVTLSYDLPQSLLSRIKVIKKASISLQGRNLLMLLPKTNIYTDPEYSDNGSTSNGIGVAAIASAPPSRYYGATISLTF